MPTGELPDGYRSWSALNDNYIFLQALFKDRIERIQRTTAVMFAGIFENRTSKVISEILFHPVKQPLWHSLCTA